MLDSLRGNGDFVIGSSVRLKSGGRRMVITGILSDTQLLCTWLTGCGETVSDTFHPQLVEVHDDPILSFLDRFD